MILDRLRRDENGFTLVELLVASMLGIVVLLAAFSLIDAAVRGQRTTENRLDATTNGRNAMEQITRQLRAQMCFGRTAPPVISATGTRVEFYASVAPTPATASDRQTVQKRTLTYVPDGTTGRGSIVETVVDGNATAPPFTQFGLTAPRTRTIVANVAPPAGAGGALFRFWRYDPNAAPAMLALTTPVAANQLQLIVQIETAFDAYPTNSADEEQVKSTLDSKITVRTADASDPALGAGCF